MKILEALLGSPQTLQSPSLVHRLDPHVKCAAYRSMIRDSHLMPAVVHLFPSAMQYTVAVRWHAALLSRVVVIRAGIVLVRRREIDRRLCESAQAEARVLSARQSELIPLEQLGVVVDADGLQDGVAAHIVEPIVEVAIYNAELVVHDHGAVTTTNEAAFL